MGVGNKQHYIGKYLYTDHVVVYLMADYDSLKIHIVFSPVLMKQEYNGVQLPMCMCIFVREKKDREGDRDI